MCSLTVPSRLTSWWNQSEGLVPWAEDNQGLISFLALVMALLFALIEQRRALAEQRRAVLGEVQALRRAEEAKALADAEARALEVNRRLTLVGDFARTVRGLLLDIERDLQDDLRTTDEFMFESLSFDVPDATVMRRAKATAETVNALVAGTSLSPALIRAARQAVAALLVVAEGPHTVTDADFREVYATWQAALEAARADITDGEMELIYLLKPPLQDAGPVPLGAEAADATGHF